jgi:hypothetical protein
VLPAASRLCLCCLVVSCQAWCRLYWLAHQEQRHSNLILTLTQRHSMGAGGCLEWPAKRLPILSLNARPPHNVDNSHLRGEAVGGCSCAAGQHQVPSTSSAGACGRKRWDMGLDLVAYFCAVYRALGHGTNGGLRARSAQRQSAPNYIACAGACAEDSTVAPSGCTCPAGAAQH